MPRPDFPLRVGLVLAVAVLCACAVTAAAATRHWPQISDDVLMHYGVFLLRQGFAPYREIVDVNLPGSYAVDWAAGLVFHGHWRVFDWCLTAVAGAVLAHEGRRAGSLAAGVFAALLWALWHVRDGVAQAGQRDYIVAVLLLLAFAALGEARDARLPAWALIFGFGCGAAAAIKPQAALFYVLLLPWLFADRKRRAALAFASIAGLALPAAALSLWLAHEHALGAFIDAARGLLPFHAAMARHPFPFLLLHALPWQFLPFVLLALAFSFKQRWTLFPLGASLAGMFGGVVSFVAQGKAYPYHRYPLLAFTLLLLATALGASMQKQASRPMRWAALAVFSYAALWFGPEAAARALRQDWRTTPALDALQTDLARFGGSASGKQVQCMDTMAGCITALQRARLPQATGFLYDCYLLAPGRNAEEDSLRARFMESLLRRPPRLFIITDQWCFNRDPDYQKLRTWPWFRSWLQAHYHLAEQREFPPGAKQLAAQPFGYRIYVHDP